MNWRFLSLGAVLVLFGAIISPAPVTAAGQCGEVLVKVCVGCHEADRFCARLGGNEKELGLMIKRMISNGAELEKEEIAPLAACLSKPAEAAKKVCGK